MKKSVLFFFILIVVLLSSVLVLQIMVLHPRPAAGTAAQAGHSSVQKDLAATLLAKGLPGEAARVLAGYLDATDLDDAERARLCYRLGTMYMDLFEYEKALVYFMRRKCSCRRLNLNRNLTRRL